MHERVPLLPGGIRLPAGEGARPARPPAVPPGGGAEDGIRRGGAPFAVRRRLQLRRPARHGGDGSARPLERIALPSLASTRRVAGEHGPPDPEGAQVGFYARAGSGDRASPSVGQQGDPGRGRPEDGRVDLRERLADPQALLHGRPARGDGGRRPGHRGVGRPGRGDRPPTREARLRHGERLPLRPETAHPVPVGATDRPRRGPGTDPASAGRAGAEPPRGGEVPLPGDLRARGSLLAGGRPAAGGDRAGVPERRAVRRVDGGVPARRVEAGVRGGGGRPARIPPGTGPAGPAAVGHRGRRDRPGVPPLRAGEGARGGDDTRLPRGGLLLLRRVPPGAVEYHIPRAARLPHRGGGSGTPRPPAAQRHVVRLSYAKEGPAKYLSGLEIQSLWGRVFRRAGLPLAYSHGFNPSPKLSLSPALAVGAESDVEFLEAEFSLPVPAGDVPAKLSPHLPAGIRVTSSLGVPPGSPRLSDFDISSVWSLRPAAPFPLPEEVTPERAAERLAAFRAADRHPLVLTREDRTSEIDLKPIVRTFGVNPDGISITIIQGTGKGVRPLEAAASLLGVPLSPERFIPRKVSAELISRLG